jgi:phage baseplate assembly protein gpV
MYHFKEEIKGLVKEHPDPMLGAWGVMKYEEKKLNDQALPRYGMVVDNHDPECLGRLRVTSDIIGPGAVTEWIPCLALGATMSTGFWQLPDIGTQVLIVFEGATLNRPVVLGCIYDLNHLPPKGSAKKAADSSVYQTKNHRFEIIDEGGNESVIIYTAKGKIRYHMTKDGIDIINELGDIQIKCRKLNIEGKEIGFQGEKKVSMACEGNIGIKAKKVKLECKKEVAVKGKNVKLDGSRGITTEGKQLAAQGDKVLGIDIHQMVVPSGSGTAVVPLPHPYIGKMADKLSDNVKINGHNAATKGSISKHDSPVHNQLPGTIKFQNEPNKEGEVTGATGKKVKVNGKEVAVMGSTVTTCNDTGARDHSMILAPGAAMPMPVIINPKNMKEWEEEKEEEREKKEPDFTVVRWGSGRVKEGEEAELIAQVKDIADGNVVLFQVWKEGQNPAVNIAQMQIPAGIEGGVAKAKWKYRTVDLGDGASSEGDPVFYFTAHSAWCKYKESGNLTVQLKQPE